MGLYDFRCVFMPYCLQRRRKGDPWQVLNREYRQLGDGRDGSEAAFDGPTCVKLTDAQVLKIAHGDRRENQFWLYDDASTPTSSARAMKEYLARVALIMKAKTVTGPAMKVQR